ncbi:MULTISPECIES: hypothetical protein [Alcanivorax]|uniref:hypothetical protein n=1 Tax=Alcanivorax TaxID=59753 RepID=UPI0025C194FA|nr:MULTISPECIES: hypothetical protein [Alcanivorax]
MSQDLQRRRRAIVTGLTPYMNEPLVLEALSLWQQNYAERPRFSLQGFVSELCQLFDLSERRHQIHMSLVQAMTLSERELADDPLADSGERHAQEHPCSQAFEQMMRSLWDGIGARAASQLRLDLAAQLRSNKVGTEIRLTMEYWLQSPDRPLAPLALTALRDQLNRTYILLCERLGPVEADQQLKAAYQKTLSSQVDPAALRQLL